MDADDAEWIADVVPAVDWVQAGFDQFLGRLEGTESHQRWLRDHWGSVRLHAANRWSPRQIDYALREDYRNNPQKLRAITEDALRDNMEKILALIQKLADRDSTVLAILGEREGGKSVTAGTLSRLVKRRSGRRVYYYGIQKIVPPWAERIVSLSEAEPGSIVVVEEGAIAFSNRKSQEGEARDLGGFVAIARHDDLSLYVVSQNASITDLTFWRLADGFILKPMSINQAATEREGLRGLTEVFREVMPRHPSQHFVMLRGMAPMTYQMWLPPDWKPEYSKAFARYTEQDIPLAVEIAARMRASGMTWNFIADQFKIVKLNRPAAWWAMMVTAITGGIDAVQAEDDGEGTDGAMAPSPPPAPAPDSRSLRRREESVRAPKRPSRMTR